jgi:tetratricopeptide (TPR) repeat protein
VTRLHDRSAYEEARGWLALAERRPRDAVAIFREASGIAASCHLCTRAELGLAYDLALQRDSALAIYEPLLTARKADEFWFPVMWHPFLLKRVGELHEANGARQKALPYYRQFVELWKNADAELQPRVRDVRARIDRIEKEDAKRR